MLGKPQGSRRYTDRIELTSATYTEDALGHAEIGSSEPVMTVCANVRRMGVTKTLLTFQSAEVVGVEIEFWKPSVEFNGIRWEGHDIVFTSPETIDNRGMVLKVSGYYQIDHLPVR